MCPPNPILIWFHCSLSLGRANSAGMISVVYGRVIDRERRRTEGGRAGEREGEREREMARVAGLGG